MIKNNVYKKGLVLGIIVLFVGVSISTSTLGELQKVTNINDTEIIVNKELESEASTPINRYEEIIEKSYYYQDNEIDIPIEKSNNHTPNEDFEYHILSRMRRDMYEIMDFEEMNLFKHEKLTSRELPITDIYDKYFEKLNDQQDTETDISVERQSRSTQLIDVKSSSPFERGNTLYVGGSGGGNYTKIQDAIDNASDGDTVFVYDDSSPYYENVVVDKSISLIGEDRDTTVIDGGGSGDVVYVSANRVNISGFTVQNSGSYWSDAGIEINSNYNNITGNKLKNNDYGIYLDYSSSNNITYNNVSNNDYGIYLDYSSSNNITHNNISNNDYGIYLYHSSSNNITHNNISNNNCNGILLRNSSNNNYIAYNNISNNDDDGICLYDSSNNNIITYNNISNNDGGGISLDYSFSNNNIITYNNVSNNDDGIDLYYSSSNNITHNNVSNNDDYGIHLYHSSYNNITYNNVSNNDYGISLDSSSFNTLFGNAMLTNTNNFFVKGYIINNYLQNIDTSNTIDEKPIYYLVGASDLVMNSSFNPGYIGVVNSVNVTIRDLKNTNSIKGVLFANISNSLVENVSTINTKYGIYFFQSSKNILMNNAVSNNDYGIYLDYSSSSNNITHNNISNNDDYGIYLDHSSSNNITYNNISNNNYDGIRLRDSSNNNYIAYNNISNNDDGIHLSYRNNNNNYIIYNNISNNDDGGIYLDSSSNNNITHNNISNNDDYGIYLHYSSSNNIMDNTMINCSLLISGDSSNEWGSHYIDTSNTVNGKPVYYWQNKNSGIVPAGAGQVILASCSNVVIQNQELTKGTVGILMGFSSFNHMINNTCSYNDLGIYLTESDNNLIVLNNIVRNENWGVHASWHTSYNNIYQNSFIENTNGDVQARDDGTFNLWNTTDEGNYWSDYTARYPDAENDGHVWDVPYVVGNSADNYPLVNQTGNETFVVYQIAPTHGSNITTITVTISGNGFTDGIRVNLTRMGEENIQDENLVLISSYQITCKFNLTGKALGLWDVVVTLPNGEQRCLKDAFEIRGFVYGIFPSYGSNITQGQLMTIYGFGFSEGVTVKLTKDGEEDIEDEEIVILSNTRFTTRFNLTGKTLGLWDVVVILPNGEHDTLPEGFEILGTAGEGYLYLNIAIEAGETQEYVIEVPDCSNLFITLQKTTLSGYGSSWSGEMALLFEGQEIASTIGSHDHILHVVDPEPGFYIINITASKSGGGILIVGPNLPELPLGEWVVGTIYCSYGSVWYQVEVPPDQDTLYFEAEAMGLWSHFDIYYEEYGGSPHWISGQGPRASIEIPHPAPGTYIVEFMDSAMIRDNGGYSEDQTRDILIKADTTYSDEPPPGYLPTITSISPDRGGNTGFVTIEINGGWLDPNATVSLNRSGYEDIIAQYVRGESDGTVLTATFNLTNKELGEWTLRVTNPDGRNATAPTPFIVEEGGEPELWVEIIGRDIVRIGRPTTYVLHYGNSGNVDADYPWLIFGLPMGIRYNIDIPWSLAAGDPGEPTGEDSLWVTAIDLLKLPAYSSYSLEVTIEVPSDTGEMIAVADMTLDPSSYFRSMLNLSTLLPGATGMGFSASGQSMSSANGDFPQKIDELIPEIPSGYIMLWRDPDPTLKDDSFHIAKAIGQGQFIEMWDFSGESDLQIREITSDLYPELTFVGAFKPENEELGLWYTEAHGDEVRQRALALEGYYGENAVWTADLCNSTVVDDVLTTNCLGAVLIIDNELIEKDLISFKPIHDAFAPENESWKNIGTWKDISFLEYTKRAGEFKRSGRCSEGYEELQKAVRKIIKIVGSSTPEDKYGPTGFDYLDIPQEQYKRFVPADQNFYYKVDFWNKENATAPACDVYVKDQLNSTLNWSTFRFEEIGFLNWTVELEESCQYFNVYVDTRPEMDLIVNVEGTFDHETGAINWTFWSLDPVTLQTPDDPMAGFLPPITESGYEIGWVCFSVKPEADLPTGTEIKNQAFVNFDGVGPFNPAPKDGPFTNTLDAAPPISNMTGMVIDGCVIQLNWTGQDDVNGSGIRDYTIYMSEDGEPYEAWLIHTNNTSAIFMGENGHTYAFYSIARDNVGNIEEEPEEPDATTIIGCYIGAYLGCGTEDLSCENISDFNQKMGKNHAIFVRYVDISDSKNATHWLWANEVKAAGAMPMFIYDPYDGLDNINISDVEYFALKYKNFSDTVFIVFGHEMNGPWYPWGNQPENYTSKFKEVAEIFHNEAENVKMCWVPNQNWGYPWGGIDYGDGYSEYYPEGNGTYGEYVDWVGLNFYEKDWDEDNLIPSDMFIANIRNGQDNTDFYEMFAVGKNKPMLIAETAAFDPNKDPTSPGERLPLNETEQTNFKNEWIKQVYNVSTLQDEFPRLNAICYFHVNKTEPIIETQSHSFYNIVADYRIPEDPNVYKILISDLYFIGRGNQLPIASFTYYPLNPIVNQTITFNASSSYDPDGYLVSYEWDFGDGTNKSGVVVNHSYSFAGNYTVTLTVTDDDGAIDECWEQIQITIIDMTVPEITDNTLTTGYTGDSFIFNATVTDNVDVSTVWVEYWYGAGSHTNVSMSNVAGDYWEKTIVIDDTLDILYYIISANDTSNNWNHTDIDDVSIYDNDNPEIADVQANPSIQNIGGYVNISATVIDNIDVDEVYLHIEYPDSGIKDFAIKRGIIENFSITQNKTGDTYYCNKTYYQTGLYTYHIWADDTSGNDIVSNDYTFEITNQPPDTPSQPSGPTSGYICVPYDYFTSTIDPDGDNVKYGWDWNGDLIVDEWSDWYGSGDTCIMSHSWDDPGTYDVRVKAKDIYDAESGWSDPLSVNMENHPPNTPDNPNPGDDAPDVDIDADLSWTGGDPDLCDTVTYDVYFGTTSPPPLVVSNQSGTSYDPGTMSYSTIYYWKIVAWDNHGASTEGPIWSFTTEEEPEPDLDCDGSLSWTDVTPGDTVTGSFTVSNIGDSGSLLDWEIESYPDWGDWMFNPESGIDLEKGDTVTIDVEVVAPDEEEETFTGEVKIVNSEDPSDYCIIPVSLITPVSQNEVNSQLLQFFQRFIERFPLLERILELHPHFNRI